jgi:hypothetical protein
MSDRIHALELIEYFCLYPSQVVEPKIQTRLQALCVLRILLSSLTGCTVLDNVCGYPTLACRASSGRLLIMLSPRRRTAYLGNTQPLIVGMVI